MAGIHEVPYCVLGIITEYLNEKDMVAYELVNQTIREAIVSQGRGKVAHVQHDVYGDAS